MPAVNAVTVESLSKDVAVPGYDRGQVDTRMSILGFGRFHRAHEAMYVDRLLNAGGAKTWGICGVGVLPGDKRMKDALEA